MLPGPGAGQVEGVAEAALHPEPGVDGALGGDLVAGALAEEAALAGVGPFGVLPDDDHVDVVGALPGQRRRGAGEEADGTEVDVEVELEAQPQQEPPLEDAGGDLGGTDRAEEDGVEAGQLVEDGI